MLIMINTCTNVCGVRAISNSIGKQKTVLQTWIRLWFQLVSRQSCRFTWNPSAVWNYPWSVQLGHNVLHRQCLNCNKLKPKGCPAVNCLSFYYGKTKLHSNILYNGKYEWKKTCDIFLLIYCKIIYLRTETVVSLHTVRWNKKDPAPVALAQIPHLELLSNVYVKIILIDNTI